MSAVAITFLGGAETGNVGSTVWGNDLTGKIEFPVRQAVVLNPDTMSGPDKAFAEHVIKKARGMPQFFKVEDGGKGTPATVEKAAPAAAKTKPRTKKRAEPAPDAEAE